MAPISPEVFARSLRGMSDAELSAFVADLWAARGWDTTVEGRTVVASDGGRSVCIAIRPGSRLAGLLPGWVPRPRRRVPADPGRGFHDADVVVTRSLDAAAVDGVRVVDAAELRDVALYAVDPETRARLFDRYVGRPPTREPRSPWSGLRTTPVPAVASVLLLVTAGVLGALAYGPDGGDGSPASEVADPAADEVAPTTDRSSVADVANGSGATIGSETAGIGGVGRYPVGVGPDGFLSVDRLAASHAISLAFSTHRWQMTYREVVDGRTRGYVRETVQVENGTRYRSSVERGGSVEFSPTVVSDVSTYADGSVQYERLYEGGTTRYRRVVLGTATEGVRPFADHPRNAIEWYLSVSESRLVGATERNGTWYFRLAGEGDSWPYTTHVRVTATVDEHGVVRQLRRSHQPPDAEALVVVAFLVTDVGNTSVTPPPWIEEARRATENGTAVDG